MTSRAMTIAIYNDETAAEKAAARMREPFESMQATVEEVSKRVYYENFIHDSEEPTIAADGNTLWIVIGRK